VTFGWDFGDGTMGSGNPATHLYGAPGTYTASLTATDENAAVATTTIPVTVAAPLTLRGVLVKLNFRRAGRDRIMLSGTLPVPAGFAFSGRQVTVDVGGATATFTLNAKGKGGGFAISKRGRFKMKRKNIDAAGALADEGLTNETVQNREVSLPVLVGFNDAFFQRTVTARYGAKAGKSGKAK
jgi:PKD repeat protein